MGSMGEPLPQAFQHKSEAKTTKVKDDTVRRKNHFGRILFFPHRHDVMQHLRRRLLTTRQGKMALCGPVSQPSSVHWQRKV